MRAEVDAAVQAVRTVLSIPQGQALLLEGTLDDGREIPGRETLDLALPDRPDLRAFTARRDQAEYASRLANGEWKPSLAFRGSLQYQEDRFSNLLSTDNQNYTFGVAMQIPLMASPGAAARRSIAEAQKRQAEHGLNASTDQARLDLETAWTALQAAAEVVSTQQKALELARESMQIAQVSYENGVITSAELNDAQGRLLETEWNLLQAKFARIVAAARAKAAAGVD
jgi:outer membrane protein TolC